MRRRAGRNSPLKRKRRFFFPDFPAATASRRRRPKRRGRARSWKGGLRGGFRKDSRKRMALGKHRARPQEVADDLYADSIPPGPFETLVRLRTGQGQLGVLLFPRHLRGEALPSVEARAELICGNGARTAALQPDACAELSRFIPGSTRASISIDGSI